MRSFLLHAYLFKACKFHLLLSRNEHITALKKLVMLNTAYFFPFSFFDTCAVLNGIINLGYFEDFYYSLFFPKEFYTKKRIRILLSYCTILYHFVESIIQDSINSTYSQSTLFFFSIIKKLSFAFLFEKKYKLFETKWNWTEFNDCRRVFYHYRRNEDCKSTSGRR